MPAQNGSARTMCGIDADGNIRAIALDDNDRIIVVNDPREENAIDGASDYFNGGVVSGVDSIIYTVPSGKTYRLTDISINGQNESGSLNFAYLYLYDDEASFLTGWRLSLANNGCGGINLNLSTPVELPAGYYIKAHSPAATFPIIVFVNGILY